MVASGALPIARLIDGGSGWADHKKGKPRSLSRGFPDSQNTAGLFHAAVCSVNSPRKQDHDDVKNSGGRLGGADAGGLPRHPAEHQAARSSRAPSAPAAREATPFPGYSRCGWKSIPKGPSRPGRYAISRDSRRPPSEPHQAAPSSSPAKSGTNAPSASPSSRCRAPSAEARRPRSAAANRAGTSQSIPP